MADSPNVTVGIALYNGEKYIDQAISSILRSTYKDFEVIVVDDGSTDKSVEIVKAIPDPRIRLVRNLCNEGLVAVRNRILKEAQGSYLAWLDQDDIAYRNRLQLQVSFLRMHEDVGACGSNTVYRIHETTGEEWLRYVPMPSGFESIRANIPFLNPLSFNTVMMKRQVFSDLGLVFRQEFGNCLDYDMWSRASEHIKLANLGEYLGEYRVHASQTSRGDAAVAMANSAWMVQRDILERYLGIDMDEGTTEGRHLHRQITETPWSLNSPSALESASTWLRFLVSRNECTQAFEEHEFMQAVARQWARIIWYNRRELGFKETLRFSMLSRKHTGVSTRALLRGIHIAANQRRWHLSRYARALR